MGEAVEGGRGSWGTAFFLTFAVLLLSVFDALSLVLLPLAILMVGLPAGRKPKWLLFGIAIWLLSALVGGGPLATMSRGWALILGSTYLAVSLARPFWSVTSRALTAVGVSLAVGSVGILLMGQANQLDELIRSHFAEISTLTVADLQARMPASPWVAELQTATQRIAALQADMFPALLAFQSLVALALVSWWVRRLGRSDSEAFQLAPLRDFRFQDELIWILIGALILYLLPLVELADRIALNMILFMMVLYALRGVAVFVFLASGARSIATMVLGAVALLFLYPVAIMAALVMGVGDTWLDVRSRVAKANPT